MVKIQTIGFMRRYGMLIVLLAVIAGISLFSDRFLTLPNFLNIMRQVSINALLAAGMTMVILLGGIDLSVGAVIALAGAFSAGALLGTGCAFLAILAALAIGALFGLINGAFIAWAKLPPFIVTLAMMALIRGLTLVYTQGRPIIVDSTAYEIIGGGHIGFVPFPVVLMLIVYLILHLILGNTKFGRLIYAVGGNEQTCRLSGINIERLKLAVYGLAGFLSGMAGIVLTSRLTSAQPTAGMGLELDAIAAVILGGTSLSGGKGKISGTLIGVFMIGVLANGLNMLGVSPFFQDVAKGLIILVAILFDRVLNITTAE